MVSGMGIEYRNKPLLPHAQAIRFAAMLRGNPLFTAVEVREQPLARNKKTGEAKANRFFVTFQPTSEARQAQLLEHFQQEQDRRADEQWEGYTVRYTDRRGVYLVENLENGKRYEVHGRECSCEQWQFRLVSAGGTCKHYRICLIHESLGIVQAAEAVIGGAR